MNDRTIMLKLFNFSSRPSWCVSHFTVQYRTKVRPVPVTTTDSKKTVENNLTSPMRKYFEEHELADIARQVPKSFTKRSWNASHCTVVDSKLAKRIAFSICSRLEGGCVLESDPGFGFMSQVFVSNVPYLFLCEKSEEFRSKLKHLKERHNNVQIIDVNLCSLFKMMLCIQEVPLPKVTDFYKDIQSQKITCDSERISWILSITTRLPIKCLCLLHLYDSSFQQLGSMTYYITLPSKLYQNLNNLNLHEVRSRNALLTALFQLTFNCEVLMTGIPRRMFLPWPKPKNEYHHDFVTAYLSHIIFLLEYGDLLFDYLWLDEEMLLIRVTPKDSLVHVFDSELLVKSFVKFLQIGLKKRQRVIPLLEKYVNNCGPLFILEHDVTVYTEFMELSPEKIMSLFMSFSKLPEFSLSTFTDDMPDEFIDEIESSEKKLNDEEANDFEELSDSESEEKSHSEDDESDEDEAKNFKHS